MKSLLLPISLVALGALPLTVLRADEPAATTSPDSTPPAQAKFVRNVPARETIALLRADRIAAKSNSDRAPVTIVDVRTPEEFAGGHIEGARNINFDASDFEKKISELDKTRPYLVHCRTGSRSAKARDLMQKLGFTRLYHMDGGLAAWTEAGGAVVKEGAGKSAPEKSGAVKPDAGK